MKLRDYKLIFIAVALVGVLLISSPNYGFIFRSSREEQYSELFLLDNKHMTNDYPSNLVEGREYLVYIGVSNHLASSAYYILKVKLGNQIDQLPNSTANTPSPLSSLYELRFLVADNETWEAPLVFLLSNVSFIDNSAVINSVSMNGVKFEVDKDSEWDIENTGFYFNLIVELWIFNPEFNQIQFHNRFVNLSLNLTRPIS